MRESGILRRRFRFFYADAVLILIGVNVFAFFLRYISPAIADLLIMRPIDVLDGRIWQVVTYMFMHADLQHIFFNMLGLLFFGMALEREWGTAEFLLFYFVTGTLAGLFSLVVFLATGLAGMGLLGASGAVYAILLAYATSYPNSEILVWGIVPVRAPILVGVYTLLELFSQVFGLYGGVAHLTHLAGFGFAFIYFLVRFGENPLRRLMR